MAGPGALDEEKKSNRFIRRFKRLEDVAGETTPHFRLPLKTFVSLQSPNPTPETLRRPQFAVLTETRRRKTQQLWVFFLMDPTMELNLSLHVLILDDVVVSTPDPFSSPIQVSVMIFPFSSSPVWIFPPSPLLSSPPPSLQPMLSPKPQFPLPCLSRTWPHLPKPQSHSPVSPEQGPPSPPPSLSL